MLTIWSKLDLYLDFPKPEISNILLRTKKRVRKLKGQWLSDTVDPRGDSRQIKLFLVVALPASGYLSILIPRPKFKSSPPGTPSLLLPEAAPKIVNLPFSSLCNGLVLCVPKKEKRNCRKKDRT